MIRLFTAAIERLRKPSNPLDRAAAIYHRIQADLARREKVRAAKKALADDVAVRRAMVGHDYAKRRAAALRGRA